MKKVIHNLKIPKATNYEKFFLKRGFKWLINASKTKVSQKIKMVKEETHLPILKDLYFLYQLIILNKRTMVLEYGCGWSTLVMHLALIENEKKFKNKTFSKCINPFDLFCVDNLKKFMVISKKRINKLSKNPKRVKFFYSESKMTKFNNRYCTEYTNHPLCNPDLIYIDGPSKRSIKNKIDNFTINHNAMMPMVCDVLKFEHFLTPGTIIVTDGRTANARFLKSNFQRNWEHFHLDASDHNLFYLNESPLGKWNKEQLKFYKN